VKDPFSRFAVRLTAALLLGLGLLLLHGHGGAVGQLFAPVCASPWEMSKLFYWPSLAVLLLTAGLSGGMKKTFCAAAPSLAVTPLALCLVLWAVSPVTERAGVTLVAWVTATVIGLALANQERISRRRAVWLVLAAAVGAAYLLFTLFPPAAGPFLDPADAAAAAVIPY
jgi:hypothetical protein